MFIISSPSLTDFGEDRDLDLVADSWNGTVEYFINVGNSSNVSFSSSVSIQSTFSVIQGDLFSSPFFVDSDSDGDFDVIIGSDSGLVDFYKNIGGSINPYVILGGSSNLSDGINMGSYISLTFSDVDGDGDNDLIVGQNGGTLIYFENIGSSSSPSFSKLTGSSNPFNVIKCGILQCSHFL